jgi:hypothetical protein
MATVPLREPLLREALLARLATETEVHSRIVQELGVGHGSARIDVAVIAQALHGYEIKSDFDTLDRLARQMHAYHRVFDTLTIVTTATFVDQVAALLPSWWGIWVGEMDEAGRVRLRVERLARNHERQEAVSVAALLWRDEAYAFVLETLGPVVKAKVPRGDLYEVLAEQVPLPVIRDRVLRTLRARDALDARTLRQTVPLTI